MNWICDLAVERKPYTLLAPKSLRLNKDAILLRMLSL